MRVLVACENSGVVRDAFRRRGADAWSCDLDGIKPKGEFPEYHLFGDARTFLDNQWDLLIAHPPCTYLSSSGLHWNNRIPGRDKKTKAALVFVKEFMDAPIPRIAIENPIGRIGTAIRKADQIVQPYQFGDDASKATCLWLKNLPLLTHTHTKAIPGRMVVHKGKIVERWANQTDSGQNRLGPSETRAAQRSITYPGIANAMAHKWSEL